MSASFEFGSQFGKVVNLAVVNDPRRAVFIKDGLVATGDINDAEAAHSQAGIGFCQDPFVVGAAVHDGLAHAVDGGFFDPLRPV
jgi:hypothetical protein